MKKKEIEKKLAGLKALRPNKENFFYEMRRLITENEAPFNELTFVILYANYDIDTFPYFKIELETPDCQLSTNYYPQWFKHCRSENIDMDESNDIEILSLYGDELLYEIDVQSQIDKIKELQKITTL